MFNPCPHIHRTRGGETSGAFGCLLKASDTPLRPGYSYAYFYNEDYQEPIEVSDDSADENYILEEEEVSDDDEYISGEDISQGEMAHLGQNN